MTFRAWCRIVVDDVRAAVPDAKATLLRGAVTIRRGERSVVLYQDADTVWVRQVDPSVYGPSATFTPDPLDEATARVAALNVSAFLSLPDRNALTNRKG